MGFDNFVGMKPVEVAVIGAGNRANKYLEYARLYPGRLKLVGVVEPDEVRRRHTATEFGLKLCQCFSDYDDFFISSMKADAVLICTPENAHFDPCIKAIDKGYNVLLEKPIAQNLEECYAIADHSKQAGVLVGICHVLRYHPYFIKIKEIVDSGELGSIISINHTASVGLDRATHSYVRGLWRKAEISNPMFLAKCCHDIDFLLWLVQVGCCRLASFGSLRWFRSEHAPEGSSERCISCRIESSCPFSAIDLYHNRREWISNFDVAESQTLDEVLNEELHHGMYGRCVYHCDNDVVDHQILSMEMENAVTINLSMDIFTHDDYRKTYIKMTNGEIDGDEKKIRVRKFRGNEEFLFDFSDMVDKPFHSGADLNIIDDFVKTLRLKDHAFRSPIWSSIESHRICYEAERSRLKGEVINLR